MLRHWCTLRCVKCLSTFGTFRRFSNVMNSCPLVVRSPTRVHNSIAAFLNSVWLMYTPSLAINDSYQVSWVNQFITVIPAYILVIFFFASAVHIAKYAGCWYPDYNRDDDDCPYNVVSKEHQNSVDINVFYDVPETLHHILNCFFALSLQQIFLYNHLWHCTCAAYGNLGRHSLL